MGRRVEEEMIKKLVINRVALRKFYDGVHVNDSTSL